MGLVEEILAAPSEIPYVVVCSMCLLCTWTITAAVAGFALSKADLERLWIIFVGDAGRSGIGEGNTITLGKKSGPRSTTRCSIQW